jgi:ribosomal protein S18 acetylase RimI-like enzyme
MGSVSNSDIRTLTTVIEIQVLQSQDLHIWKELRLEALADAPHAFGDTLEEARQRTDKEWEGSLLDCDGRLFIAKYDGSAVGMARVRRSPNAPSSSGLYSMWVSPTARFRGVGKALMDAALAWAGEAGVGEMVLCVTQGNDAAKRLYLASGFVETGELQPLRSNPHIQMEVMAKRIPR